jgi:hypothetical protein
MMWEQTVERHNATRGENPEISLLVAQDLSAAKRELNSSQVDAAVVDLRLDGNGREPENSSGNDVIATILESKLAVAAVFTGEPTDARIPAYARDQVRVFTKGGDDQDGIDAVMDWLVSQFPIIQCMQGATRTIREEMANVFNHSIWPRWKFWMDDPDATDKEFLSSSVARHIISHVHEGLSEALGGRAHAEEWYLLPPNPAGIRTGDLTRNREGRLEIVITPRCDIATQKYQTIQLAACDDKSEAWERLNAKVREAAATLRQAEQEGKRKDEMKPLEEELAKARAKLNALVRHDGNRNGVHFLPKMKLTATDSVGPLLVRFDSVRSIAKDSAEVADVRDRRFATLSPVFLPSVVERLGAFFSRIGTPDYCHFDDAEGRP